MVETSGDLKVAIMEVAAMEERATAVVATNHRAAMVDQAVAVAMVVVVATVAMRADPAAMAEGATMLAAAQVVAPTGEVATRILASARVVAIAEVAVATAEVAAAAITTMSRPHMVVGSHHQGSLDPVVELHRLHHLAAIRCSLATWTSRLMRTH